jgi:hypothetical protein
MTVRLVRMQAKKMAASFWDMNRSDRFRAFWPDVKQYVGRFWPAFVDDARSILIDMLTDKTVAQHIKDEIEVAIIEDSLRASKAPPLQTGQRMLMKPSEPGRIEQRHAAAIADLTEKGDHDYVQ